MARIFQFPNEEVRDRMIIAKLSDRIHNIQSIETFTEQQRLYECFKNLFILNNVKVYIKNLGDEKLFEQPQAPIAKLFTQCCKATFEAFLTICKLALEKNILQVRTMLQLAFKKFAFEMGGLWQVTTLEVEERHLLRLYQGILRKYEARMHQEWETFDSVKVDEFNYCRKFFSEYNFSEEQIRAILDYKDAYSLKEATARLLYDKEFVIAGFLTSELKQGRIKT